MQVALFGGTGFVGGYLVDALIDAGHTPALLVRSGSLKKLRHAGVCRLVTGDLACTKAIDDTLHGCAAVIFCVGILREAPKNGITFEDLQYAAVVRVAEAAKAQGISRFLLMSANGVKLPGTAYQETKYRAEQYVIGESFDATVFRPSIIFGDPRGTMEFATQLRRDMVVPPLPAVGFFNGYNPRRGQFLMSPAHVQDVALAFVRALEDPETVGKVYELGGPENLTWSEMIQRVATAVGKEKWVLPMPIGLMRLAATMFDWLEQFPVTRDQLTMLAEGNTADPAELQSLIDHAARRFIPENLAYLNNQK